MEEICGLIKIKVENAIGCAEVRSASFKMANDAPSLSLHPINKKAESPG